MAKINITVPDTGGAKDLEVIEVLVAPGDSVEAEAGLISVESDKFTMEIPSPKVGLSSSLRCKSVTKSMRAASSPYWRTSMMARIKRSRRMRLNSNLPPR